jgi:hypothetical protein
VEEDKPSLRSKAFTAEGAEDAEEGWVFSKVRGVHHGDTEDTEED